MERLPIEIIYKIINYLLVDDIINLAKSNNKFGFILQDTHFWQIKAKNELGISRSVFNVSPADRFQQLRKLKKNVTSINQLTDKRFLIDTLDVGTLKYLSSYIKWSIYDIGYSIRLGMFDLFYHLHDNNYDYIFKDYRHTIGYTHNNYPIVSAVIANNKHILNILLKDKRFNDHLSDALCLAIDNAIKTGDRGMISILLKDRRVLIEDIHMIRASSNRQTLELLMDNNPKDYNYNDVLIAAMRMSPIEKFNKLLQNITISDCDLNKLLQECYHKPSDVRYAYLILLKVQCPETFFKNIALTKGMKRFLRNIFNKYGVTFDHNYCLAGRFFFRGNLIDI